MNTEFEKALNKSYKKYLTCNARSTEKLKPIHGFIAQVLQDKLGSEYEIISQGFGNDKEYKFDGRYYKKNIDITILKNKKPLSGIAFKFVTSNYKQNANNYFENMLGENCNIKRGGIVYAQILVLRDKTPYYGDGTIKHIEKINTNNLTKYLKLSNDNEPNLWHKPDLSLINFVQTNDINKFQKIVDDKTKIIKNEFNKNLAETSKLTLINPKDIDSDFDENMLDFLEKHSDFSAFIDAIVSRTKAETYGK
jgi:hypothetical protein